MRIDPTSPGYQAKVRVCYSSYMQKIATGKLDVTLTTNVATANALRNSLYRTFYIL
jgi:hypothetical protein